MQKINKDFKNSKTNDYIYDTGSEISISNVAPQGHRVQNGKTITIKGTDFKDEEDIMTNFINFGGSRETYNDERHTVARRLIKQKQNLLMTDDIN